MFGTNGNDNMQGLQAKNFKFDDSVDIDDAPDWLVTKLADLNHFEKHLKNGITHICKNQNPQNPHLQNDKFTNLQNIVSNETALNLQNACHSEFLQSKNEESQINSQILRHSESLTHHSESLIRHSELSQENEESQKNLQNTCHSKPLTRHSELSQESEESQINSQNTRHFEPLIRHSERSEESQINSQILRHSEPLNRHSERSEESQKSLQNVNSQNSQNTPKLELTFTEKYVIKDFAHKLYGVKIPETKQRIGIDAATQCKIHSF